MMFLIEAKIGDLIFSKDRIQVLAVILALEVTLVQELIHVQEVEVHHEVEVEFLAYLNTQELKRENLIKVSLLQEQLVNINQTCHLVKPLTTI